MRLALGAKFGKPGSPPVEMSAGCVAGEALSRPSTPKRYAIAAAPTPVAVFPRSARRVMWRRFSLRGFIALFLRDGLVEVQDLQAQCGVRRMFGRVDRLVAFRFADGQQLRGRV